MNNPNNPSKFGIESLYNAALDESCRSMSEESMVHVLNEYPPSQVLHVIWKILHVADENQGFDEHTRSKESSTDRGREMCKTLFQNQMLIWEFDSETLENLAKTHQTKFIDKYNFCNHFDLKLFFKVVEITELRHQLFTIFQICIQVKGFQFPKKLAEEWIKSETLNIIDENKRFHYIEQGLKLGIFLGDANWLNESALVLSHTFNIIHTKWMCRDQNLKLLKTIQCLTKWLSVVSNYKKIREAKFVLGFMLNTISSFENMVGRTLCIANAYVSVSEYHFTLGDYTEAWSWLVKAVYELNGKSADVLKLRVISHVIRVCCYTNKLSTAKKLINRLRTFEKKTDQNTHVCMLSNEAIYLLVANKPADSIYYFQAALDSKRNSFGYYNLETALLFIDNASARYTLGIHESFDFYGALCCVSQAISIMNKIGLPDDHAILINAVLLKALILEEQALHIRNGNSGGIENDPENRLRRRSCRKMKREMLNQTELLYFKALNLSLKAFGEKSLLTAKLYCGLGRLYQNQAKYDRSEKMQIQSIRIKESILKKDHAEVAQSLSQLAHLYAYRLKKFREAEQLFLRCISIYENAFGPHHANVLYNMEGLMQVYLNLNELDLYDEYLEKVHRFVEIREEWLRQVHAPVEENDTKDYLNLEKIKSLLSDNQ